MTLPLRRIAVAAVALALAALSIFMLERPRFGLDIMQSTVGPTPVTTYRMPGADGPPVVVAHGFAGSRQIMQTCSLTLAHAGYLVVAFDFPGHGRNPVPMSGDVTAIDGTTRLLVDQTLEVAQATLERTGAEQVAFPDHSMASDVIIRAAIRLGARARPVVALSPFSGAVTERLSATRFVAVVLIPATPDFEGLFFLLLITPVILLFFLTFGLMGRWVSIRTGPAAAGFALGVIFARALGVSFPLFDAGGRS